MFIKHVHADDVCRGNVRASALLAREYAGVYVVHLDQLLSHVDAGDVRREHGDANVLNARVDARGRAAQSNAAKHQLP